MKKAQPIRLDHTKLFGYKIVADAARVASAKIGQKGGFKNSSLGSKIGGKVGVK